MSNQRRRRELKASYRKAGTKDVEILSRLFEEFSDWHLERTASIQKAIAISEGELLVAEVDGRIVGFVNQVFFEDPLHAGPNSLVTDLFVKKEFRGLGIGSELTKRALLRAKAKKVKEVHVTTREDNYEAMRFYEKHGFSRAGVLFEFNP